MNETYDTATMTAIIHVARREGHTDDFIAAQLGIARNNPAFGYKGDDQLRASISERLERRGHALENIAEDFGLTLAEATRIYADPNRRVGLDEWASCIVSPGEPHHEDNILVLIEKGRASLNSARSRKSLSPRARLALLVDAVGLAGTQSIIAAVMRCTEDMDATARTLHLPREAVKAVVKGSFPTAETAPTLQ